MQEQDPKRHEMQPPIPTRPPKPETQEDMEKVAGGPSLAERDPGAPPPVNTGVSSGQPIDHTGGAGLGQPPGEGDAGSATSAQTRERKAADPQDRRPH